MLHVQLHVQTLPPFVKHFYTLFNHIWSQPDLYFFVRMLEAPEVTGTSLKTQPHIRATKTPRGDHKDCDWSASAILRFLRHVSNAGRDR